MYLGLARSLILAPPSPGSPASLVCHRSHGTVDCQVPVKGSEAASVGNGVEEEEEKHASVTCVAVPPRSFKKKIWEELPPPILNIWNRTAARDSLYHAEKHSLNETTLCALVYPLEFTLTVRSPCVTPPPIAMGPDAVNSVQLPSAAAASASMLLPVVYAARAIGG